MQPPTSVPFYLDWTFWTAVTAVAALMLSQLPPLYTLIRKAKLEIELFSYIHISHKVGNPNVQLHFILTNAGGRSVRIKAVTLEVQKDGNPVTTLYARNYLQNPGDKTNILFTPFTLKSKDEWAHIVNFLNYFSREEMKCFRSSESKLKEDIKGKIKLLTEEDKKKEKLAEAAPENVLPFINMFNSKFVWLPGEYAIKVNVQTSSNKLVINKDYRFTLFESDSEELSKAKEDFKYGDGIYWDSGKHPGVIVTTVES